MKTVSFKEMTPGMVLYPVEAVNSSEPPFSDIILLVRKTEAGEDHFWGDKRSLTFLTMHEAHSGPCSSAWRCADTDVWAVVEDQVTLDKVRLHIKKEINWMREILNESEKFVDEHLKG